MISKIKYQLILKITNRIPEYLSYRIHNTIICRSKRNFQINYTHILSIVFELLSLKDPQFDNIDLALKEKLKSKINEKLFQEINNFKNEYKPFIDITAIESDEACEIITKKSVIELISISNKLSRLIKYEANFSYTRYKTQRLIRIDDFTKIIALSAPFLLLGGLLRQLLFASQFNFKLSLVFSLSDYISSSIDALIYTLLPLLVIIVVWFFSYQEEKRFERHQEFKRDKINSLIYKYGNIAMLFFIAVCYFVDSMKFFEFLPFSFFYPLFFVLPNILRRYIKNFKIVTLSIVASTIFLLNIVSATMIESYNLRDSSIKPNYEIEFTESNLKAEQYRIVTTSLDYYVLWCNSDSMTYILKKEMIKGVKYKNE